MLHPQRLGDFGEQFVPETYDQLLARSLTTVRRSNFLFKVTLPFTERAALLSGVYAAGVAAAALFPNLEGVAREMAEEGELERHRETICHRGVAGAVAKELERLAKRYDAIDVMQPPKL